VRCTKHTVAKYKIYRNSSLKEKYPYSGKMPALDSAGGKGPLPEGQPSASGTSLPGDCAEKVPGGGAVRRRCRRRCPEEVPGDASSGPEEVPEEVPGGGAGRFFQPWAAPARHPPAGNAPRRPQPGGGAGAGPAHHPGHVGPALRRQCHRPCRLCRRDPVVAARRSRRQLPAGPPGPWGWTRRRHCGPNEAHGASFSGAALPVRYFSNQARR